MYDRDSTHQTIISSAVGRKLPRFKLGIAIQLIPTAFVLTFSELIYFPAYKNFEMLHSGCGSQGSGIATWTETLGIVGFICLLGLFFIGLIITAVLHQKVRQFATGMILGGFVNLCAFVFLIVMQLQLTSCGM